MFITMRYDLNVHSVIVILHFTPAKCSEELPSPITGFHWLKEDVLLVLFLNQNFATWFGDLYKFGGACIDTNLCGIKPVCLPGNSNIPLDGTSVAPQLGERASELLPLFKSTPSLLPKDWL